MKNQNDPHTAGRGVSASVLARPSNNTTTMFHVALAYAQRGWPILPLVPNTKRPLTPNGFKDATTCEDKIKEWWSKWPFANIGIRTGAESEIIVLDVEVKNGAQGLESLAEFESEFGPPPPTLRVRTPSGGLHLYFKHPGGKIKNRTGFRPGLDLRGDGGYIVAPPSQIDGVSYQWV